LTRGAAPTKARIIHVGPDGSRSQPAIVNLKNDHERKGSGSGADGGDILIVLTSGIKSSIERLNERGNHEHLDRTARNSVGPS